MKHLLATTGFVLTLAAGAGAGAQDLGSGGIHASAGLCVLLDGKGQVTEARLVQTSGDPQVDQDAVDLARKLQWSPPYPRAGWLGMRITVGDAPPGPTPKEALPHCDAASDAKAATSI